MEKQNLFQDEIRRRRAWDGIEDLVVEAHDNAVAHGFYKEHRDAILEVPDGFRLELERNFVLAQIAKIGSELGEAVEVIQKQGHNNDALIEELSDVVIRTLDLVGFLSTPDNFSSALMWKMEKNRKRPYLHGKLC